MKGLNLKWLIAPVIIGLLVAVGLVSAASPVADAVNAYFANMPADIYRIGRKDL